MQGEKWTRQKYEYLCLQVYDDLVATLLWKVLQAFVNVRKDPVEMLIQAQIHTNLRVHNNTAHEIRMSEHIMVLVPRRVGGEGFARARGTRRGTRAGAH